jgi:hypothetical protein
MEVPETKLRSASKKTPLSAGRASSMTYRTPMAIGDPTFIQLLSMRSMRMSSRLRRPSRTAWI